MLTTHYFVALCFGAVLSIVHADKPVDSVSTTTESHEFISNLNKIITRMESSKQRIAEILNQTRRNDIKSLHELLIGKGYQHTLNVGYHKLYTRKLSWYDALEHCRREDAHLAVIDSAAEATVVSNLVKDKLPATSDEKPIAYIGYHDYWVEGWIDVFFKPLDNQDYIKWKEGVVPHANRPKCAVIDGDGYLRSTKCLVEQAFICETKQRYSA